MNGDSTIKRSVMFGGAYNILAWQNEFTSCFNGLFLKTEGPDFCCEPHRVCAVSLMTRQNMVQSIIGNITH